MKHVTNILAIVAVAISALILFACTQLFSKLENPADPDSSSYPGYPTVSDPDDIALVYPADGAELAGVELRVTKVAGASLYAIRIAESPSDFEAGPIVFEKSDYPSNRMDISAAALEDVSAYYWQARAWTASGASWGSWGASWHFDTAFPVRATAPVYDPPGGYYASGQSVTLSCASDAAIIWYTTDGSDPASSPTRTMSPSPIAPLDLAMNPATILRSVAEAPWRSRSAEASARYARLYSLGSPGPAGGLIFYDKGSFSDGWRYLEAAPVDQSSSIQWYSAYGYYVDATGCPGNTVGEGSSNTAAIVSTLGEGDYAARLCDQLALGGYDDWFLPSVDELREMYSHLKLPGLGNIASSRYWSSTEWNPDRVVYAYWLNFGDGHFQDDYKDKEYHVRAAREF